MTSPGEVPPRDQPFPADTELALILLLLLEEPRRHRAHGGENREGNTAMSAAGMGTAVEVSAAPVSKAPRKNHPSLV